MSLPITFDDVAYFANEYRGDLIIARGVIYYFPHTNASMERKKRGYRPGAHLGLIALPFELLGILIRELQTTTNCPKIREMGLWNDGESSQSVQARLDAHISEKKKEPTPLVDYELSLPKPMRFPHNEIKNLSLRGGLRFDTEYDSHDFSIGFHRKKLLRESLWEGGFISQSAT